MNFHRSHISLMSLLALAIAACSGPERRYYEDPDDFVVPAKDAAPEASSPDAAQPDAGAEAGEAAPPPFAASCAGSVRCNGLECASWTYSVADSSTGSSTVVGRISTPQQACDATSQHAGGGNSVSMECDGRTWTLVLDRPSMLVYITAAAKATPLLSWTPECRP